MEARAQCQVTSSVFKVLKITYLFTCAYGARVYPSIRVGSRIIWRSQFSHSAMWILVELRLLAPITSAFLH